MKIVISDYKTISDKISAFDVFKQFGDVILYDTTLENQVEERIKDADMVICNKTLITEAAMKNSDKLKYIGLFATGYNNIDTKYASKKNITVCNAGSYSTNAVAQHTFALILNYFSKVSEYNSFVHNGGWKNCKVFSPIEFETHEIAGKTIGIVGYGNIGKAVAKIANAFSMNVLVYTRSKQYDQSVEFVQFDELLKKSDIVTVHCPLNSQSEKMFDDESFAKFKKDAFFINTARGGIVDEKALKNALETGKLKAAAIDTLTYEPMKNDCVLYNVKNLIITPHIAWAPIETVQRVVDIVIENIKNYLDGNPTHKVN